MSLMLDLLYKVGSEIFTKDLTFGKTIYKQNNVDSDVGDKFSMLLTEFWFLAVSPRFCHQHALPTSLKLILSHAFLPFQLLLIWIAPKKQY